MGHGTFVYFLVFPSSHMVRHLSGPLLAHLGSYLLLPWRRSRNPGMGQRQDFQTLTSGLMCCTLKAGVQLLDPVSLWSSPAWCHSPLFCCKKLGEDGSGCLFCCKKLGEDGSGSPAQGGLVWLKCRGSVLGSRGGCCGQRCPRSCP